MTLNLKANGEDTLITLMTTGEDTLMTPVTTRDYLVTTLYDVSDDSCDDIDNQEQLAGSNRQKGLLWGK
jgi:hypothetical protein